eukprot:53184-Chlamydomonas_euryale.AAC.1
MLRHATAAVPACRVLAGAQSPSTSSSPSSSSSSSPPPHLTSTPPHARPPARPPTRRQRSPAYELSPTKMTTSGWLAIMASRVCEEFSVWPTSPIRPMRSGYLALLALYKACAEVWGQGGHWGGDGLAARVGDWVGVGMGLAARVGDWVGVGMGLAARVGDRVGGRGGERSGVERCMCVRVKGGWQVGRITGLVPGMVGSI